MSPTYRVLLIGQLAPSATYDQIHTLPRSPMLFISRRRTSIRESLPSALFPAREYVASVGAWAKSIQELVESQECQLRRIVHCKAKTGTRPEFLLVYVRHPCGKDAIVFAERDTLSESGSGHSDGENTPPSRCGETMDMDMRTLGIAPSGGRVRVSCDGTEGSVTRHILVGWAEVHTVKFRKASKAPSVAHLAALLTMLDRHAFSPSASVEVRSGWFVYCVAEVLREIFGGEAKTSKKWVRAPYGGMKVDRPDTVDTLIREFTLAWNNFSRRRVASGVGRLVERTSHRREGEQVRMDSLMNMLRAMSC